ncbi:MAG: deoxyribonuclease IV [Candidatus Micrarchaeota archaeon]|nr:deoxyribonuclease IV [Candidatus Micrarchaeota archaeon]
MDKVGRHISSSGSIDKTVDTARSISCNSMQIFASSPMQWHVRSLDDEEVRKFREKKRELRVDPIVVHMPYLPNLASPNKEIYEKSIAAMKANMERCDQLDARYLVTHLGSTMGEPRNDALRRISSAINSVINGFGGMLLLEGQAGQKNSVGSQVEDLAELYDHISHRHVGYCIDTCHAFAAGYDISKEEVLDRMDAVLGWKNVHVIHANDSKFGLGSGKDRHENIGKGYIGRDGIRAFLNYKDISSKPILLETVTDRKNPDSNEIELVRSLIC